VSANHWNTGYTVIEVGCLELSRKYKLDHGGIRLREEQNLRNLSKLDRPFLPWTVQDESGPGNTIPPK
jgi:hypothetical protein